MTTTKELSFYKRQFMEEFYTKLIESGKADQYLGPNGSDLLKKQWEWIRLLISQLESKANNNDTDPLDEISPPTIFFEAEKLSDKV